MKPSWLFLHQQLYIPASGEGGGPCGCVSLSAGALSWLQRPLSSLCFLSLPANIFRCTSRENMNRDQRSQTCCVTQRPRKIQKPCSRKRTDCPGFLTGPRQSLSMSGQRNCSRREATLETKYMRAWAGFEHRRKLCLGLTCLKSSGGS